MPFRDFDMKQDMKAVQRIWQECGWVDESEARSLEDFFGLGTALVAPSTARPNAAYTARQGPSGIWVRHSHWVLSPR